MSPAPDETIAVGRGPVRRGLELVGLVVVALVWPPVTDLAGSPDVLVQLGADRLALLVASGVGVVAVVGPVLLLEAVIGRVAGPRPVRAVHLVALAVLGAVFGAQLARVELAAGDLAAAAFAVVAAAAVVAVVHRWPDVLAALGLTGTLLLAGTVVAIDLPAAPPMASVDPAVEVRVEDPTPIVLVTFDALPLVELLDGSGAIDAELFPSFGRLADRSTWYRNHVSVGVQTGRVVPTLLSGQVGEEAWNIWQTVRERTLLANLDRRYTVRAQETVTELCTARCEALGEPSGSLTDLWRIGRGLLSRRLREPQQAGTDVDEVVVLERRSSTAAVPLTRATIAEISPVRRQLLFLHVLLPHAPYVWTESCDRYASERESLRTLRTEVEAADVRQASLVQLRCADRLLGELLDRLDELDLLDPALVVVVADHGAAAIEGSRPRWLEPANVGEVLWAPLLIKAPGQRDGAVVDDLVRSQDVLPTVLGLLGAEATWPVDGVPAGERASTEELRAYVGDWVDGLPVEDGWTTVPVEPHRSEVLTAGPWGVDTPVGRSLHGTGRHAALVGRPVSQLEVGGTWSDRFEVDGLDAAGERTDGVLSLRVTGSAGGPATGVVLVADGRVVAAGDVEQASRRRAFALLAPEDVEPGSLDLYVVTGPADAPVLHPTG